MENGKCSSALLVLENEYQNFLTFPSLNICLTYTYRGRQTELPFANFFFRCLWELGWSRSQSQELGAQSRSPNWVLRTHCWSHHLLPSQVYVTLDLSQKPRSDFYFSSQIYSEDFFFYFLVAAMWSKTYLKCWFYTLYITKFLLSLYLHFCDFLY